MAGFLGGGGQNSTKLGRSKRKFGASALGKDDEDSDGEGHLPHGYAKWSQARQKVYGIVTSEKTDWLLATMILSSVAILILDADMTAKRDEGLTPEEVMAEQIATIFSRTYTCIYAIEIALRVYVFRKDVFRTAMLFDFLIVAADVLLLILDIALGDSPQLSFLRMFRLARLFRFVRVVGMFPELQFLVKGFISSFSAVFWGSILMWIVILMWAIIAVYWIHPVNSALVKRNFGETFEEDDACGRECRAWSSVWWSVITLCQTVVFGDSWGASAIEIIEEQPLTLFVFAGMYATITLGVLNLIVAAIVDSGAQAREEAQEAKKRRQRNEEQKNKERQKNRLLEICKILDDDESGSLSYEELLIGFDRNQEFKNAMKDYNIDRKDLDVLFRVFDEGDTGVLDYQDFFNMIDSAREQASQQVLTFVRFAVMDLRQQVTAGQEMLKSELIQIKELILEAEHSLHERVCHVSGEAPPAKKKPPKATDRRSAVTEPTAPAAPPKANVPTGVSAKAAPKSGKWELLPPPAKTSSVTKTPSRQDSPSKPRALSEHSVSPETNAKEAKEKPAPLQQVLKMNKELLRGMKKLLDAQNVDFLPAMAGRQTSQGSEKPMGRIDSNMFSDGADTTPRTSGSRQRSSSPAIIPPDPAPAPSSWIPSMPSIFPKALPPDERRTAI